MVLLLGEFPHSFMDALGEDHKDVLVVRYPERVDKETLPDGIRIVIAVSHGTDNVDTDFLKENDIEFYRIPVGAVDVAEFCASAAISLMRKMSMSSVSSWSRPEGKRLRGKTWGLVGLGIVGKELAHLVNALGCKLIAYDPYVQSEILVKSLDELLGADIISIHVPLVDETKNMINAEFLSRFDGTLIDVSRGGVVDTEAVLAALKEGTLYGAALDVFPEEPYSIDPEGMNLIATPHIASNTQERWEDAAREVIRLISK